MRWSLSLETPEETEALGRALAGLLREGDVLALIGDLGAGKTFLVRAIAAGLGVDASAVSSPTFVIVTEHEGRRVGLIHADAYRLTGPGDLAALAWDRLLAAPAAMVVEWADRIGDGLPTVRGTVRLTVAGPTARRAEIDLPDHWSLRDGFDAFEAMARAVGRETMCPVTGRPVPRDAPTWPFADERARDADLHGWFSGRYRVAGPDTGHDTGRDPGA